MPKTVYKAKRGQADNQSPFTYAILVIKPSNKPSIAPKVQHCRLVLGKTPYRNNFFLIILSEHGDLHKHAAESLGMLLLSVAIISLLRRQPSSASKLQKMQIF